jgi:hemoglobin
MHALRCWPTVLAAGLMLSTLNGHAQAQDQFKPGAMPADTKMMDANLYRGLKDAMNKGVDLYNSGDHYGCYRLYQGIVLSLKPLLADRPELERKLDKGLADAELQQMSWQRAWALRKTLDEVRAKLKDGSIAGAAQQMPSKAQEGGQVPEIKLPKPPAPAGDNSKPTKKPVDTAGGKSSLWNRLGGQTGVTKIIDDFTERAAANPNVDFSRGGRNKLSEADITHFKQEMVDFVSSVAGGPLPYTGKNMKKVHKDMKITNAQFDAAADDLKKAMMANNVKLADINALLDLVETTRKDIVEGPENKSPAGKTGADKKQKDGEPPFEEVSARPDQSTWVRAEPRHVALTMRAMLPGRWR